MIQEHTDSHVHFEFGIRVPTETNHQRMERIKKKKNIRKEKVNQARSIILQSDFREKMEMTREQKKEMQKEKNRVAAQHSRDRQKKYLDELEEKMKQMQKQIEQQLCQRCKASLSDHSTSEEEHREQSLNYESTNDPNAAQVQNNSNILNEEKEIEELPFLRQQSVSDREWGNIGRYFCIFLVLLSVAMLTNSVQTTSGEPIYNAPVSRILTEEKICEKPADSKAGIMIEPIIRNGQQKHISWPFKINTGEPTEECKNQFWQHYLNDINKKSQTEVANPYDWNLVTCASPNLVHISTVYEKSINHIEDKWTFLITNPIVSQVQAQKNGDYHLDQVNYLDGVYQLIAEKVALKKVIGNSCIK